MLTKTILIVSLLALGILFVTLQRGTKPQASNTYRPSSTAPSSLSGMDIAQTADAKKQPEQAKLDKSRGVATFAGGCFWCMEPPFDKLDGVLSTTAGYAGGDEANPSYKQVSAGKTGHAEAIEVAYDPEKITYAELLDVFWRNIDPTTPNRQFCDYGRQYRTVIFYRDDEQKQLAVESKKALDKSDRLGKPIVTEIVPASEFYVAEEYHQDFYKKNPSHYKSYRYHCGRDQRLEELWGDE